jgi:hypothetical protein
MATTNGENVTTKDIVLGLDAKVDTLIVGMAELKGQLTPTVAAVADHETRIRKLESTGLRLSGAWTMAGIVTSALAGVLGLALGAAALFT